MQQNVPECTKMHENVTNTLLDWQIAKSKCVQNLPKCPRMYQNATECARMYENDQNVIKLLHF